MQSGSTGQTGDSNSDVTAIKIPVSGVDRSSGSALSSATGSSVAGTISAAATSSGAMEKADRLSSTRVEPIVITVENNLDKAMKILKRKLIKEGLFKELKTRRYFEKPSEKKKRKQKETVKKNRKEEARIKKSSLMT